ncbi:hypothetical protein [Lysobacter brunescens]|uniref:Secreted protein n=1 Tax=Lysobacter brunescens TaxID=262323 RepID=A0ABW2YGB2_9GAMM
MKSILAALVLTLSIAAASAPASAARIGAGTLDPVGPTPYVPGVWRAKVRYVNVTTRPDGTVSSYSYINITADSQVYCEGQLASLTGTPGVTVVDWCWFDAY